jgi:DNA relaxase NicK
LNSHLKCLSFMSVYEYLVKCDEITSLGLLLGISATYRGKFNTFFGDASILQPSHQHFYVHFSNLFKMLKSYKNYVSNCTTLEWR